MSAPPQPEPFFTVAFGTPFTISLLSQNPSPTDGEMLTVGWRARLSTSVLPHDSGPDTAARPG
ncbi:hypothetical protein [Allokutzneria albata]|uniref:Uncharacterized protein n=1 Tax=Allokutzneria albata TaxID=211114 RepID=A0A1G9U799_ALLAB|nr:hypothetical protein [Allokutzneria albata]SDM55801.1 hypothetical protein SAMN04489726_2233 [Allokutzneria albata]